MQVFKTNKKIFWANELKSWLWDIAFTGLAYWGLKLFLAITNDNILVGIAVIVLLKLADTLTQYHVVEIQIDNQGRKITFILNSIMSGEKVKKYELEQVTSELINNSGLTKYFSSPYILKIFLRPKETFRINSRYGFSLETLASVDNTLKLTKT